MQEKNTDYKGMISDVLRETPDGSLLLITTNKECDPEQYILDFHVPMKNQFLGYPIYSKDDFDELKSGSFKIQEVYRKLLICLGENGDEMCITTFREVKEKGYDSSKECIKVTDVEIYTPEKSVRAMLDNAYNDFLPGEFDIPPEDRVLDDASKMVMMPKMPAS